MKIVNRLKYIMAALFAFVISIISGQAPLSAYLTSHAESTAITYSNVLDDLNADSNFDETAYPAVADDYSLSVITIAEGVYSQLFIYVYQPSFPVKSLVASSINISTTLYSQLSFKNYKLNLVSIDGVFQKYAVDGLVVSSSNSRGYQISSIYRLWNSSIDEGLDPSLDNEIEEVVFEVGKQYIFENDGVYVHKKENDIETIRVTQKYCGYIRFMAHPHNVFGNEYDAHFVAFSTDKKIDNLYYAEVSYLSQEVHYYWDTMSEQEETFGELKANDNIPVSSDDEVKIEIGGWGGETFFFNRIQSVEDFKNNLKSDNSDPNVRVVCDESKLEGCKWVLRFCETDYEESSIVLPYLIVEEDYTKISSVTIMHLYFETDGIVYNLGVVDNKQTGSDDPFATYIPEEEPWWQKLIALIFLVLFVVIFWPLLAPLLGVLIKAVIKGFGKIINFAIKAVLKVITFPLRLIGKLWVGKG